MEDNKFVAVGRVIADLGEQSGTSAAGKMWRKRTFVIETQDAYPQKMAFLMFNDRIDQYPVRPGDFVRVSFEVNSREYQGRWYTDLRAWRIEPADAAPAAAPGAATPAYGAPAYGAPAAPAYGAPADPMAPVQPAAPSAPGVPEDLPF